MSGQRAADSVPSTWPTCDYCADRFSTASKKAQHMREKHADSLRELEEMRAYLSANSSLTAVSGEAMVKLGAIAIEFARATGGTAEDMDVVARARESLEKLVREQFPAAKLYVFGSNATGLPERGSDVDMAADLTGTGQSADAAMQRDAVERVYKTLNRHGFPRGLFHVKETRVPIVSFKPVPGGKCTDPALHGSTWDLSFQLQGVRNSHWLRHCLLESPSLRVAALWLKAWSKDADVNDGRHGKLTSYAFLVLLIYFAMATGRITYHNPATYATDGAHLCPSFLGPAWEGVVEADVGETIAAFFDYYCTFDFQQYVVSLTRDPALGPMKKSELEWLEEIPGSRKDGVYYHICIEDPYEDLYPFGRGLNLGRKLTEHKACKLRMEFLSASQAIREGKEFAFDGKRRTTAETNRKPEQCYLCGKTGHVRADCPEKQACFRCGSTSHLARDCTVPAKNNSKKGYVSKGPPKGKTYEYDAKGFSNKGSLKGKVDDGGGKGSVGKASLKGKVEEIWNAGSQVFSGKGRSERGLGADTYDPDYQRELPRRRW